MTAKTLIVDWLGRGGIAQATEAWAIELSAHRHDVEVVTRPGRELGAGPVPVTTSREKKRRIAAHRAVARGAPLSESARAAPTGSWCRTTCYRRSSTQSSRRHARSAQRWPSSSMTIASTPGVRALRSGSRATCALPTSWSHTANSSPRGFVRTADDTTSSSSRCRCPLACCRTTAADPRCSTKASTRAGVDISALCAAATREPNSSSSWRATGSTDGALRCSEPAHVPGSAWRRFPDTSSPVTSSPR